MSNIDDALRAQRSRDEYRRRQDREEQARLRAARAEANAASELNDDPPLSEARLRLLRYEPIAERRVRPLSPPPNPVATPFNYVHRPQSPDYPPPDLDPRSPAPSRPNTPRDLCSTPLPNHSTIPLLSIHASFSKNH